MSEPHAHAHAHVHRLPLHTAVAVTVTVTDATPRPTPEDLRSATGHRTFGFDRFEEHNPTAVPQGSGGVTGPKEYDEHLDISSYHGTDAKAR
jgi:hypothetical protein